MNNRSTKEGSLMLVVVVLMSVALVLCTRMWQSTAYVFDIAAQKQLHTQQKWATRGILNCGIAACSKDFQAVCNVIKQQGGKLSLPITYNHPVPHLKAYSSHLSFELLDDTSLNITAALHNGAKIVHSLTTRVAQTTVVA